MGNVKLRVLFHVHKYPPEHNAGAEWTAHLLVRWLGGQGVECLVLGSQIRDDYELEGVEVRAGRSSRAMGEAYRWANVVVTHLDATTLAMVRARRAGIPLVHLVHNHRQLRFNGVRAGERTAAIFNSRWVAEASGYEGRGVVCHPYVPASRYFPMPGPHDSVTLFNLFAPKGAVLFYEMARLLPELSFLGVEGAYGRQVAPPKLANLEIAQPDPDVRNLLARTGLVVMPSTYESWGRICQEAGAMGIPTLASMMPGLAEQAVAQGFLMPGANGADWAGSVRRHWKRRVAEGAIARQRAKTLQAETEEQLVEVLDLLTFLAD